ncbi:copper resistance CopC family protein [Actinoplanes sp. NPDC026623]|uniref:copper resistance CopC family protein n=1 Tax=Actinoplanes sp. NPDC026623 TaxID=3155610 RepID=UPI0033F1D8D2
MTRTTRWGRFLAAGGALIVVAIGVLMVTGGRDAADLGSVSPANGAVLREPPQQVSLTFDAAVRPAQIHIGVSDYDGLVASGAPVVTGSAITEPVSLRADGDYVLAYHVVLDDGRTFSGSSRFRVSSLADRAAAAPAGPAPPAPAAGGPFHITHDQPRNQHNGEATG